MNVQIERGLVVAVLSATPLRRELLVEVGGEVERAFQEPAFGVFAEVGDRVLLNTTAVRLQLGTGGMHFVIAVEKGDELRGMSQVPADQGQSQRHPGHIMKLRYTPLQMAVHAIEEQTHPLHERMRNADSLEGTPVIICELHSMLPAVVMALHYQMYSQETAQNERARDELTTGEITKKEIARGEMVRSEMVRSEMVRSETVRGKMAWSEMVQNDIAQRQTPSPTPRRPPYNIVYLMTDGGALSLHFSQTVAALKQKGLLSATVTVGHAYGGDLEAVNLYSGLLAARHVLCADCIVVAMGPGIVGTGTPFGHTGIEAGQAVNAVHALHGEAVVVPRLSFADPRDRHHGVSHHTLTALGRVALVQATVPLPTLPDEQMALIQEQLTASGIHQKHRLLLQSGRSILDAAAHFQVPLVTMGRSLHQDLAFFLAAGAAGEYVAQQLQHLQKRNPPERYARREESALFTDRNC